MFKSFQKKENRIMFYPKQMFNLLGIVFLIFGIVNTLIFVYLLGDELVIISVLLAMTLLFSIPFFVLGSQKIIIDKKNREIVRSGILGNKTLARFSDVENIIGIKDSLRGQDLNSSSYAIMLKSDPYGNGIKLNWSTLLNSNKHKALTEEIQQLRILFNTST